MKANREIEWLNNELFLLISEGIKKHYGKASNLPEDMNKKLWEEIDVIIEKGYQTLFISVKELMEKCDLTNIEVTVLAGIGNQSIVAFLMGITEMNPLEFSGYRGKEWWTLTDELGLFSLRVPYSKFERVVTELKDNKKITNVFDSEKEEGGEQNVIGLIKQFKSSSKGKSDSAVQEIAIEADKRLDVIVDCKRKYEEDLLSSCPVGERLNDAVLWITERAVLGELDTKNNGLTSIPLMNNDSVVSAISARRPQNIYDLAGCIRDVVAVNEETYPSIMGTTKTICELAYCKSRYPSAYFESYVNHIAKEDTIALLDKGVDAILDKVEELIDSSKEEKAPHVQEEIIVMALEEYTRKVKGEVEQEASRKHTEPMSKPAIKYKELKNAIQEKVIGNDELVDYLSIALTSSEGIKEAIEEKDGAYYPSQNMLIVGGTGTGKSFTVKTAAKAAGREFIDINMAEISAVGYVGKNLESVIEAKARASTPEKWKNAVMFFDEIDKVVLSPATREKDRTFDLIPEILKLIEGDVMSIKMGQDRIFEIPTKNMLFILAGAFEEVNKHIIERKGWDKQIGFGLAEEGEKYEVNDDNIHREIELSDLEKYGVSRQLLGRMNRVIITKPLTEEGYRRILTESSDSAFLKQQHLLRDIYNLNLRISNEAIQTIAESCMEMKVGARGLNAIINTAVSKGLAEALNEDNVRGLDIVPDEKGNVKCIMVHR